MVASLAKKMNCKQGGVNKDDEVCQREMLASQGGGNTLRAGVGIQGRRVLSVL